MMPIKKLMALLAIAALGAMVLASCQSVATTSAKLRNQEGNYDMAIDLCREALASNPNDAEAYFQLGVAYSQLDSVGLAYQNFTKSAELDPKKAKDVENNIQHNFAKHYKLGQSAYNRQDYQVAAEEFLAATQADPTQSVGYYSLGGAYANIAREDSTYHAKAIEAMDKVLEMSNPSEPNYVRALQIAGRELVRDGRPEEAEERFKRLIEEDPTSYQVIEDIGYDLLNQREWKGAVIFMKMAAEARAKIDADEFELFYNIGAALYNLKDEDPNAVNEAIGYYEQALELREDEPQTIFNIAVAYVVKDDYLQASEWLERYVNLEPSDAKGWQLLARCYSETGDKAKAREAMARFEALRG